MLFNKYVQESGNKNNTITINKVQELKDSSFHFVVTGTIKNALATVAESEGGKRGISLGHYNPTHICSVIPGVIVGSFSDRMLFFDILFFFSIFTRF